SSLPCDRYHLSWARRLGLRLQRHPRTHYAATNNTAGSGEASDRLDHQAILFANDESFLLAKRIGAAVGQLPEHRLSRFPRLSRQRPQQVFQATRKSSRDGRERESGNL